MNALNTTYMTRNISNKINTKSQNNAVKNSLYYNKPISLLEFIDKIL